MSETIPPSRQALAEALNLSGEILKNLELSELPLTNIALKASRLARLLNEYDVQKIMNYEASGYPTTPTGVTLPVWDLALAAGRKYDIEDKEYIYSESISELEELIRISEVSLAASRDPDVSVSSANPQQYVWSPKGNYYERQTIRESLSQAIKRLASRRALLHQYALHKHYELKFSEIADDVFSRIRQRVDGIIGQLVPDAAQRLTSIYDNLQSENPEDWSNAVHSCRRVLKDLADAVFPPSDVEIIVEVDGKSKSIKLGSENYINRIMAFVQDASTSERFHQLVGSHLGFLGDRLDSVIKSAQKGSHTTIMTKEEADRYVVYTYLLVGDILSLYKQ